VKALRKIAAALGGTHTDVEIVATAKRALNSPYMSLAIKRDYNSDAVIHESHAPMTVRIHGRPMGFMKQPIAAMVIEEVVVKKSYLWQLAMFVLILLGLNYFFRLHISIIGSVVLTVILSMVFSFFRQRR
jgi:hypothetical protein